MIGTGPVVGDEVDVLVGLAERRELGDDVDGDEAGPLERLQQAVATVDSCSICWRASSRRRASSPSTRSR